MKREHIDVVVAKVLVEPLAGTTVGEAQRLAEYAQCDAFVFNGRMWPANRKEFNEAWNAVYACEGSPRNSERAPVVENFQPFNVYDTRGNRKV